MSHWNYRCVRFGAGTEDERLGIVEAYYDDDGVLRNWSDQPMVVSDTLQDLSDVLAMMQKSLVETVLEETDLEGMVR
jgi:hypothetical protein